MYTYIYTWRTVSGKSGARRSIINAARLQLVRAVKSRGAAPRAGVEARSRITLAPLDARYSWNFRDVRWDVYIYEYIWLTLTPACYYLAYMILFSWIQQGIYFSPFGLRELWARHAVYTMKSIVVDILLRLINTSLYKKLLQSFEVSLHTKRNNERAMSNNYY